jgi:hypothetical protein
VSELIKVLGQEFRAIGPFGKYADSAVVGIDQDTGDIERSDIDAGKEDLLRVYGKILIAKQLVIAQSLGITREQLHNLELPEGEAAEQAVRNLQ